MSSAVKFSGSLRNARAKAFETTIGASPTLQIRSDSPPATCEEGDVGTLLAAIPLPADWLGEPENGTASKIGTWSALGVAAGVAGHWRLKQGGTCHAQGLVTPTSGSGSIKLDNVNIAVGQQVRVDTFVFTEANA